MSLDFTPEEEDQMLREFNEADQRAFAARRTASPQLAQTVSSLYSGNRDANPGVILSAAQAVASGRMTREQVDELLLNSQKLELEQTKQGKKEKSWWERNVTSKVRTASRWTMATLNFVPQTIVGLAAQPFTDNSQNLEGFFISTDLGTLLKNDEVAGDGFFLGGKAAELQAERARRYRGEIDGKAWTVGRGAASIITQPGSREYSILSGLLDAATAIATPALPGAQLAKGRVATQLAKIGELELGKLGGIGAFTRTAAGLLDAERAAIDPTKVRNWIDSRGGMQVVEKVAKVSNIDEAMQMFPNVQDAKFWIDVVDAKDPGSARTLLLDNLGRGVDDFDLSRRETVKNFVGRYSRAAKLMSEVPGQHVVLQGGNARDVATSVKNVNNYLKLFGKEIPNEERINLVDRFSRALVENNGNMYETIKEIKMISDASLLRAGVPEEALKQINANFVQQFGENSVYGSLNDLGEATSFNAKLVLPDGRVVEAPLATAGLQSEMMRTMFTTLPDPRRVRRMTSTMLGKDMGWIFGKGSKLSDPSLYRELRLPFSAIETFQNQVWRPLTLMTPGYVLRNMTDSAFRLSFTPGMKGGVFHPLQWIQMASYKRLRGTLTGEMFDNAEDIARGGMSEFAEATSQTMREAFDHASLNHRAYKDRVWRPVNRGDKVQYRRALQDEVSLLHYDEVTRRLAGAENPTEAVESVVDYLKNTSDGRAYLEKLQSRWANKSMRDVNSGELQVATPEFIRADGTFQDENIRSFVEQYALRRLNHITNGNEVLRRAVADGVVRLDDGTDVSIFTKTMKNGVPYGYADEWTNAAQKVIDDPNVQLSPWLKGSEELDRPVGGLRGGERARRLEAWDRVVDKFFGELYPKRSAYLMQSPAFRQFYYNKAGLLLDELNEGAVREMGNALRAAAKAEGKNFSDKWLAQYVNDGGLAKRIINKIEDPKSATGKLSLNEFDAYAKGSALDSTKDLFYNASAKSNFADILRVVSPFGSAWAEVLRSWSKLVVQNPESLRRVGVSVQGLKNADPDGDGKGFFWKDPQTGEYVFNYPFNKQLGPLVSYFGGIGAVGGAAFGGLRGAAVGGAFGAGTGGVLQSMYNIPGVGLQAPAKSLNMGLNIFPGVGPFAQIAASKILGRLPEADEVRKFLTPYGEPEFTLMPSWGQKVYAAISDPESNRLFGDMKIETMRVLATTGEYDLSNAQDQQRLENDAESRARVLLMLRGLGQFVGPTRPTAEFKVETYAGDYYGSELAKAFRVMQSVNYDTAVETFLNTFGDDAFLYMASKTKANYGGRSATQAFGEFERNNKDLFARYKDVAGFFGPEGTNFDYSVYLRQLQTGAIEKIKPSDFIEEAQSLVGRSLYRNAVRMVGGSPNDDQREWLSNIRNALGEQFPGFKYAPMTFNKLETQIGQIRDAAFDPVLDGNKVAEPTRLYLQARDKALEEVRARGFKSLGGKKVADIRSWLRSVADSLVAAYPEFERIYDRVLFNEIDLDAGE